jgi:RNA polymerase sigma-70 factor, ECF subfamily
MYEKHGAALAAYACCCGVDFASAEDMVQQIFLKLVRGEAVPTESPLAYLCRAVRNRSFNLLRGRRREVELPEEGPWLTHAKADPAEVLAVQSALRELPSEQREAVVLRIWGGLTLQEIANATETSLNTVASRYRYGLEKLRERLTERTRLTRG